MTHPTRSDAPLQRLYPALAAGLPWLSLGALPTPVDGMEPCRRVERLAGLWIKRDDLSGTIYGGNKVRKLELLLARALADRARTVMTFGTAGSNHVLATALYARAVGLHTVGIMTHQANARTVGRNLLGCLSAGAQLHIFPDAAAAEAGANEVAKALRQRNGTPPAIVRGGGSSPLGAAGFVNAALELADQVKAGMLPAPDVIYVALGTMGTAAGIALGMALAGLPTRVVPVRVVHPSVAGENGFAMLVGQCCELLHDVDPKFPLCDPGSALAQIAATPIRHDFFGDKYGVFTSAGQAAVRDAGAMGIRLEGTYTGKTFAALLADHDAGQLDGQRVLFWNTYNSQSLDARIAKADYRALPAPFHRYFETPYQPLDC